MDTRKLPTFKGVTFCEILSCFYAQFPGCTIYCKYNMACKKVEAKSFRLMIKADTLYMLYDFPHKNLDSNKLYYKKIISKYWLWFHLIKMMAEILHQLRLVVYPIIYKVLYIPGGAGFLTSTVVMKVAGDSR